MSKFTAKTRTTARLAGVGVIAAGVLFAAAPSAIADSQPAANQPSYLCRLFASEPQLSADGHEITGSGTSRCVMGTGWQSQKVTVTLEQQILPGLLVVRAQTVVDYSSEPFVSGSVSWPCYPGSTGTYTIETSWYGQNGEVYAFKYPGSARTLTCAD